MQKIKYNLGDNINYDYFIVATKKEIQLNENSLAFRIDKENHTSQIVELNGITGNYDFILEQKDKQGIFIKHIPCLNDEIEK